MPLSPPFDFTRLGIAIPERMDVPAVNIIAQQIAQKTGHAVIPLHMGIPGIPAPQVIKEAQIQAIRQGDDERYCLEGYPPLMEELARYYRQHVGVNVHGRDVVTVNGGMEAGSFCFEVVGKRDERRAAIFVTPGFAQNYERMLQCDLEPVQVSMDDGRETLMARIRTAIERHKAGLILLSDPNNPTGAVLTDGELQQLADICNNDAYNVICLVDDAYLEINYSRRTTRHLMQLTSRALSLWSASKVYSQAGNRIGAILGPPEAMNAKYPALKQRYETDSLGGALKRLRHNANVNPNLPAQVGVAAGLAYDNTHDYELCRSACREYQKRINLLKDLCLAAGFKLIYQPEGALYLAVDHPASQSGDDLAKKLLMAGVSSVPLWVFMGANRGVRLSVSKMSEEAGKKLESAFKILAALFHN